MCVLLRSPFHWNERYFTATEMASRDLVSPWCGQLLCSATHQQDECFVPTYLSVPTPLPAHRLIGRSLSPGLCAAGSDGERRQHDCSDLMEDMNQNVVVERWPSFSSFCQRLKSILCVHGQWFIWNYDVSRVHLSTPLKWDKMGSTAFNSSVTRPMWCHKGSWNLSSPSEKKNTSSCQLLLWATCFLNFSNMSKVHQNINIWNSIWTTLVHLSLFCFK